MKRLLKESTYVNSDQVETLSTFRSLLAQDDPERGTHIQVVFNETKIEDGVWPRDYVMNVTEDTIIPVFFSENGERKPLLWEGLRGPVMVNEFIIMRFLCWDHNFVPLKMLVQNALRRRKAEDWAKQRGFEPIPYEFDLPAAIPAVYFLNYLREIESE